MNRGGVRKWVHGWELIGEEKLCVRAGGRRSRLGGVEGVNWVDGEVSWDGVRLLAGDEHRGR